MIRRIEKNEIDICLKVIRKSFETVGKEFNLTRENCPRHTSFMPEERLYQQFADNRAMFAIPWEGTTLIGTTDLDHPAYLDKSQDEPCASPEEIEYIMEALHATFPGLEISTDDMISSFAGLRPIISTGKANPSEESRGHAVWEEDGLLTIAGGKYTTFRIMAAEVLNRARAFLPNARPFPTRKRLIGEIPDSVD